MGRTARTMVARLLTAAAVLLAVFAATFVVMRLAPGGPFATMDGMGPEVRANLERKFGLDRPAAEQFVSVLSGYVSGEFGPSLTFSPGTPVSKVLAAALPVSMELGLYALVLALVLGVLLGTAGGLRPGSIVDRTVSVFTIAIVSTSVIVLGALARKVFVVEWRWFPPGGFTESVSGKVLPVAVLALAYAAIFARLVRGGVAAAAAGRTLPALTARGVRYPVAVVRYVLPAALIPMLEYMGPAVAGILTGSFVVETLFEVPGCAACFVQGAAARDYPLVSAAIMVYALILVGLNLLFETLHSALDPRQR